jgi:hypothetical protein
LVGILGVLLIAEGLDAGTSAVLFCIGKFYGLIPKQHMKQNKINQIHYEKIFPFFISISVLLGLSILVISIIGVIKSFNIFKNPFSNDFGIHI